MAKRHSRGLCFRQAKLPVNDLRSFGFVTEVVPIRRFLQVRLLRSTVTMVGIGGQETLDEAFSTLANQNRLRRFATRTPMMKDP